MSEDEIPQRPGCLKRIGKLIAFLAAGCGATGVVGLLATTCVPMAVQYGIWTDTCPVGSRLELRAQSSGLGRGMTRELRLHPRAVWVDDTSYARQRQQSRSLHRGGTGRVRLQTQQGEAVADDVVTGWHWEHGTHIADVRLPDVPDGDYVLLVDYHTPFDAVELELPLPLYANALVHVMPDRPLVRPGDEVQFRSVTLKASDRSPVEERPGRWRLANPDGDTVWEEKDRTSAWGIAATSFPLDAAAMRGVWTMTWQSGESSGSARFEVRPFELPRLQATVAPAQSWLAPGERLSVRGTVSYASGAALRDTEVSVRFRIVDGEWPLPIPWTEPKRVRTDGSGNFTVDLGPVPADLKDRAVVGIQASATDETGETVGAASSVVLSASPLRIQVETELGGGLVGGFNNRAWIRVTQPDGVAVPNSEVVVRPAWEDGAEGWRTTTDDDGVGVVQLDPGDPITVVLPEIPVRHRPFVPARPELVAVSGVGASSGALLEERRALGELQDGVDRCSPLVTGTQVVKHTLRVGRDGRALAVVPSGGEAVSACVASVLQGARLHAGDVRTLETTWRLSDPRTASLSSSVSHHGGGDASEVFDTAALRARRCVDGLGGGSRTLVTAHYGVRAGDRSLRFDDIRTGGTGQVDRCLQEQLRGARLDDVATADGLGTVTWTYRPGHADTREQPMVRTMEGYELQVQLAEDVATTGRVVLPPGRVPPLRIRLEPPMPAPGSTVTATFVRGEGFHGDIEGTVRLMQGSKVWDKVTMKDKARKATFSVPADARGFAEVSYAGARSVLFVPDPQPFALDLSTPADVVRPGTTIPVTVRTTAGGVGVTAAVGLTGVDGTMSQLVALPGADDLGVAMVRATSRGPAFGIFTTTQLALGQIRGEHAAMAALLRVGELPADGGGEPLRATSASRGFDPEAERADAFHRVLTEVYRQVGAWEEQAAEGDLMTPERMVAIYERSLEAVRSRGGGVVDAFGVEVQLDALPDDLLVLADPREVVQDSTKLPEDVVSWTRFVRQEVR